MKKASRSSLLFLLPAALLYICLAPLPAQALTGNEYTIASQPDESFLCAGDWQHCFTDWDGIGKATIKLGLGSSLGGGAPKSVTIAKDESSPFVTNPWIIYIECFTDVAYTAKCPDWVQPNEWNGHQTYIMGEFANISADNKHWTADFTNPLHNTNPNGSSPALFTSTYYYRLVIGDNGWNIGAYGSSDGAPYYKITGIKSKPDPVIIIPGILGSWEKNGSWVIDPILHTYDNLIDTFLANGYVEGQTLFKFPYDWEQSDEASALELKNKISEVKTICGCNKVDLVGHSMGGLIATYYIESDGYQNDVDQLFLVATPLSGAPKAYKAWEAGEMNFGDAIRNTFLTMIFQHEATKADYRTIYDYMRGKPVVSVQELLPVNQNYLQTTSFHTLVFPNGYPYNAFLANLVTNFKKISASGVIVKTILADTKNTSTPGGFIVASSSIQGKWVNGQPVATVLTDGDSTVPRWSIENVTSVDKELDFTDHNGAASSSAPYLFKEMAGIEPSVIIGKTYNSITSFIFFKLHSPIDMEITTPDGKKLGKNFISNTEVNEVPDAFYSGFTGDNEYAIIVNPMPGQYKIDTIGTDSGGHYTIEAEYADTATTSTAAVSGTSTPGATETHTFIVSATSTTISLPPPPQATSTPTTTTLTPETCIIDMTAAYKNKWIGKKAVFDTLTLDCKALKGLFATRDTLQKIPAPKLKHAEKLLLTLTLAAIKLTLADMNLLAKDKGNTKDAVLLIGTYTTWFKNHEH